ncbi:hypothetical protein OGZ02_13295 [Brachyspira hyodysenteriae]|nr:hypothetical protein [Brachyspira hyodysenteriae]MDA1469785.1 hypothetical protein [Brachyspira hyodysenteriae]
MEKILAKNNINPLDKIKISEDRKHFASKCMPIYEDFFPEIIEEIKAMAEGLSIDYKDICSFYSAYTLSHLTINALPLLLKLIKI